MRGKVVCVLVFVRFTVTGLLNTAFASSLFSPALHCVFTPITIAPKYTKPNGSLKGSQSRRFSFTLELHVRKSDATSGSLCS